MCQSRFAITYIAVFILVLALLGCGRQHKAESLISNFVEKNIARSDYSLSFSAADSTKNLTDSMITVMKTAAGSNKLYKKPIQYGGYKGNTNTYAFVKVMIVCGKNDTLRQTFYLDHQLTNVIAFKEN